MFKRYFVPLSVCLSLGLGLLTAGCSKHKSPDSPEVAATANIPAAPAAAKAAGAPAPDFMAENAKRPGVVTLPSGLQYKVIVPGTGVTPKSDDYANVNYIGYHMDGRELDSSYKLGKPVTVPIAGLIPGWAEALLHMKEGAKWELYIPANLAYGKEGVPGFIQPDETLHFQVELVKVRTAKEIAKIRLQKFKDQESYRLKNEQFLADNGKNPGIVTTASGLQYKIVKKGTGRQPQLNDTVEVNYRGTLIDGTEFDSSYARDESAVFPVAKVIKGWTEALQLMKEGAKWKIYVPASLAYGSDGAGDKIRPDSTLIFDVELVSIK
jgi:FKBP-type peptidyl-prolyl cis-trans isomerase